MPAHFSAELEGLKERLLVMASRAEEAVSKAVKAAVEREDTLAFRVKEDDSVLDKLEVEIDDVAIHLLAKAPLASDLRLITVAMKISHDLERVADEATTIARQAIALNKEIPLKDRPDIESMAKLALDMLRVALDAFVNRTPERAREVIPRDREVDRLNKEFVQRCVQGMIKDPETITRCLNWMRISKSLERIADHATNIAEEVVYLHEGRDIRHLPKGNG